MATPGGCGKRGYGGAAFGILKFCCVIFLSFFIFSIDIVSKFSVAVTVVAVLVYWI